MKLHKGMKMYRNETEYQCALAKAEKEYETKLEEKIDELEYHMIEVAQIIVSADDNMKQDLVDYVKDAV